jgi:hypothetical protein
VEEKQVHPERRTAELAASANVDRKQRMKVERGGWCG